MTRISTTSRVTAKMLTVVRTGLALRPATIMCLFMYFYAHLWSGLYKLGAFRLGQIKERLFEFLIQRRLLKGHLDGPVFDGPMNNDKLGRWNSFFQVIILVVHPRIKPAVFAENLLSPYL